MHEVKVYRFPSLEARSSANSRDILATIKQVELTKAPATEPAVQAFTGTVNTILHEGTKVLYVPLYEAVVDADGNVAIDTETDFKGIAVLGKAMGEQVAVEDI